MCLSQWWIKTYIKVYSKWLFCSPRAKYGKSEQETKIRMERDKREDPRLRVYIYISLSVMMTLTWVNTICWQLPSCMDLTHSPGTRNPGTAVVYKVVRRGGHVWESQSELFLGGPVKEGQGYHKDQTRARTAARSRVTACIFYSTRSLQWRQYVLY